MPELDLALLIDAARAAGEIALRYWQNAPETWDKHDASPVTEADLAVNDVAAFNSIVEQVKAKLAA